MAITFSPVYPVAGEEVTLTLHGALGSTTAWQLTGVPNDSALALGLQLEEIPASETTPTSIQEAAERDLLVNTFTPDVDGEYTFTAYDLREHSGTPAYGGDPSGDSWWTTISSSADETVSVGWTLDIPIEMIRGHGIKLRLEVVDDTVRDASLVDPLTNLSRAAARKAAVTAAVDALVGIDVDNIGNDIYAAISELAQKYDEHRRTGEDDPLYSVSKGNHYNHGDKLNKVGYSTLYSNESAFELLNNLKKAITRHQLDASKYLNDIVYVDSTFDITVGTPGSIAFTTGYDGNFTDLGFVDHGLCAFYGSADVGAIPTHNNDGVPIRIERVETDGRTLIISGLRAASGPTPATGYTSSADTCRLHHDVASGWHANGDPDLPDKDDPTAPDTITWATADDTKNVCVSFDATTMATATVLQADLRYRAYNRHYPLDTGDSPPCHIHPAYGPALVLTASLLDTVIVEFLDAVVDLDPTPALASGEPSGIMKAEHKYGFKKLAVS